MSVEYIEIFLKNINEVSGKIDAIRNTLQSVDKEKKEKIKNAYLKELEKKITRVSLNMNSGKELKESYDFLDDFVRDLEKTIHWPDIEDFIRDFKNWTTSNFNVAPDKNCIEWLEKSLGKTDSVKLSLLKELLRKVSEMSKGLEEISGQLNIPLKKELDNLLILEKEPERFEKWLNDIDKNINEISSSLVYLRDYKNKLQKYKEKSSKPFIEKCSNIIHNSKSEKIDIESGVRDVKAFWKNFREEVERYEDIFMSDLASFEAIYNDLFEKTRPLALGYIDKCLSEVREIRKLSDMLSAIKEKCKNISSIEISVIEYDKKYKINKEMPAFIMQNEHIKKIIAILNQCVKLTQNTYASLEDYADKLEVVKEKIKEIAKTHGSLRENWEREIEHFYNRYRGLSESSEFSDLLNRLNGEILNMKQSDSMEALINAYLKAREILELIEKQIDLSKDARDVLEFIEKHEKGMSFLKLYEIYPEQKDKNKFIEGVLELLRKEMISIPVYR